MQQKVICKFSKSSFVCSSFGIGHRVYSWRGFCTFLMYKNLLFLTILIEKVNGIPDVKNKGSKTDPFK